MSTSYEIHVFLHYEVNNTGQFFLFTMKHEKKAFNK